MPTVPNVGRGGSRSTHTAGCGPRVGVRRGGGEKCAWLLAMGERSGVRGLDLGGTGVGEVVDASGSRVTVVDGVAVGLVAATAGGLAAPTQWDGDPRRSPVGVLRRGGEPSPTSVGTIPVAVRRVQLDPPTAEPRHGRRAHGRWRDALHLDAVTGAGSAPPPRPISSPGATAAHLRETPLGTWTGADVDTRAVHRRRPLDSVEEERSRAVGSGSNGAGGGTVDDGTRRRRRNGQEDGGRGDGRGSGLGHAGTVCLTRDLTILHSVNDSAMPGPSATSMFEVLADPTRRRVVELLAQGPRRAGSSPPRSARRRRR